MELKDSVYIDSKELKKLVKKFKIFIVGAGEYGLRLRKEFIGVADIVAFVDGYKSGSYVGEIPIISFDMMKQQKTNDQKIIISTIKYAKELSERLEEMSYAPEKDFYIWDDECCWHCNKEIKNFMEHNRRIWKQDTIPKENKILIPYAPIHDVTAVTYSYCANYLAEKYDAEIYCTLYDVDAEINETVLRVYQSFGVKDILRWNLSLEREKEAEKIVETIWENIREMGDWSKISIFGISFGTTIIRHYLRQYMPCIDFKTVQMKQWLVQAVKKIVYLYDYVNNNNVKAVVLWDGVRSEGYLRDIAITKGIPVYAIHYTNASKLTLDYAPGSQYFYYKKFWNRLSEEEQEYGLKWGEKHLKKRLQGSEEEISYMKGRSPYALKRISNVLEKNEKIKILICPHSFEDDSLLCGKQIFDNNMFEWLCHLGELSEIRDEYDWYIKVHPNSSARDLSIIEMLTQKYSNIKMIRKKVSPLQLKEEGIDVVLTIAGTLGHEYPMLGIPVINAGVNPHIAFNFNYHPQTKAEYDWLIHNLKDIKHEVDLEEIYQFYCIHYLYYKRCRSWIADLFFKNSDLHTVDYSYSKSNRRIGSHRYSLFLEEWSEERHEEIKKNVEYLFDWLDDWKEDTFYR